MNAYEIKIECEEDGFWMVVQLDEEIPLVTNEGRLRFRIHGIAPELLQEVERTIGEWWAEGQAVARMPASAVFRCAPEDIDESGGYDTSDPKHARYHSTHTDHWDNRDKTDEIITEGPTGIAAFRSGRYS